MDRGMRLGRFALVAATLAVFLSFAAPTSGQEPAAPPPTNRSDYRSGAMVAFTGKVIDVAGEPLPGITVVLEVSRSELTLGQRLNPVRMLRRDSATGTPTLHVLGETGADGVFRIEWSWNRRYDTFAVVAALPIRQRGEELDVLRRVDVSLKVDGSPTIDVPIELEETPLLAWARKFFHPDAAPSADERRVYHEVGRPDRVDTAVTDYDPDSSWWYFEIGRVYRFREGRLDQVEHFEPVTSPSP